MQALTLPHSSLSSLTAKIGGASNPLSRVKMIDVFEVENLGLAIYGRLEEPDFDYIRSVYEQKLRLTAYPHLYLEFHGYPKKSTQRIWDELTMEVKFMGDFCRIAIVHGSPTQLDTSIFGVPGVIIQQFRLTETEAAKKWLR